MLFRNQSSWSASAALESVSRSSDEAWGNSSPKIVLTALRDGFGERVTASLACD
jgi:hypothetical protein